jgi:gliding motility-associated-like protein
LDLKHTTLNNCCKTLVGQLVSNEFSKGRDRSSYLFALTLSSFPIVIIFLSSIVLLPIVSVAQCIEPVTDAGLYCDPDHPQGAPIICSLECLDGFTATMPSAILPDQPEFLCGNSGTPNNLSWFAFVAGDTLIDITITPTNCVTGSVFSGNPGDNLIGIQSGIYSSCGFTEEDIVTCYWDCYAAQGDPVNLVSNEFVPGEVYYLFVDGCGGSVCDYTVTVNTAMQAFEVPEITNISNEYNFDLENDTICQGAEVAFMLDSLDLDINFIWSINPPTAEYPTGMHPVTDTNIVSFVFSDEGVFDIIVYAFNECDANEPDTFQVTVAPLGDEVFTDVILCEECILEGITLVSPDAGCIIGNGTPLILTEDPNGDGVPGWQGLSEVTGPGLQTNMVQNALGCGYMQSVNIVEIPIGPREKIDLYFCFSDFPVSYDGIVFNNPGDERNITIENGAVSGCDSLINITANPIDLIGNATVGDCENGIITIDFNIILVEPTDYDSITYNWFDDMGNEITDSDNIDDELQVINPGVYVVEVTVFKEGDGCGQLFGAYNVDANSLIPDDPMIAFAPNEICITESLAQIYVNNQGLSEEYTWSIIPDLPFTFGGNSDTIFVDVSGGQSFEFCVSAMNECGESGEICDDVKVSEVPSSAFEMPAEICIDSILNIEYIGGDGTSSTSEFTWSFNGGIILNSASPLTAGPFELEFPAAGTYDISMYLTEEGCQSPTEIQTVTVTEPFVIPTIDCFSMTNGVSFSFDGTIVDGIEVIITTGQPFEIIGSDSIVIGDLGPEELVEIEILFNDDHVCGGQMGQGICMSLPCPDVAFDVILSSQGQCIDEDANNITLDVNILGDDSGIGEWTSPFITNDNDFNVSAAGVGSHSISYSYEIAGCLFTIDTSIYLYSSPVLDLELERVFCDESIVARLIVQTNGNMLTIDGIEVIDVNNIEFTEIGSYSVVLTNSNGCSTEEEIFIETLELEPSFIDGESEVLLGESSSYETNGLGDLPNVTYSWTLDGEIICDDCLSIDLEPMEDAELCMLATYADNCEQEICIDIKVIIETEVYVPNIFSPNNDGVNDFFKFQSNSDNLMIESITIFDRWGEIMFASTGSINNEEAVMWDGLFNGSPCNGGVYVYVLKYLDIEGNMVVKAGDVTIAR